MEPLSMLVSALVAGAVAATKDVVSQEVKAGYSALKALVLRKFGGQEVVSGSLKLLEIKPDSGDLKKMLGDGLANAGAGQDTELLEQAQKFLVLLKKHGLTSVTSGPSYRAELHSDGAIAQGIGAVAAGKGGVAVGGSVQGDIVAGKE